MSNGFVLATLDGVIALISFSGDTLWRLNLGHPVFSTPLWDGNQLYVASVDKFIYAGRVDSVFFQIFFKLAKIAMPDLQRYPYSLV